MKRGFTMVELLVVVGMIAILAVAFTTSIAAARRRAMIARATQEIREMTNAILAFEQFAEGRSLKSVANGGWADCSESAMAMILGGKSGESGEKVPVLYNGHVVKGYLNDPWGTPYQYSIVNTGTQEGGGDDVARGLSLTTAAALPNFFRLSDAERK